MDEFDEDAPFVFSRASKTLKVSQADLVAKRYTTERGHKGASGVWTSIPQNSSLQAHKGAPGRFHTSNLKDSTSLTNAPAVTSPPASLKSSSYAPASKQLRVGNLEVSASAVGQSKYQSQQNLNSAIKEEMQDEPQEINVSPQIDASPTEAGLIDFRCIKDETQRRALEWLHSIHPSAFDGCLRLRTLECQVVGYGLLTNILLKLRSVTPESSPDALDYIKAYAGDLEVLGLQGGWLLEHVAALERTAAASEALRAHEAKKQACEELNKKVAEHEMELANGKRKIAEREEELANEKRKIAELKNELADEPVVPQPPAPFFYY